VNEEPAHATLAEVSLTFAGTRGSWALAWYDPDRLDRRRITIDHTLVAEDLTDFPVLITDAVIQASLC
jgi:hypothetical protein